MFSTASLVAALAALAAGSPIARRASAPTASNAQLLGYAADAAFNPALYRDGGGGGCLDGVCVIGFSDSFTTSGPFEEDAAAVTAAKMTSFAHNSIVTFAPKGGAAPPTKLTDYGNLDGAQSTLVGPAIGPVTAQETAMGGAFSIWPNSNMVPISTNQLVGVANAVDETSLASSTLYSTMYTVELGTDVTSGHTVPTMRVAEQLFQPDQNLYGTFCIARGQNDGYLYLFSVTTPAALGPSYLKVARVPTTSFSTLSAFTYWTGSAWSSTQPSKNETASAIYKSDSTMDTGEVFWSAKHSNWVLVTSDFGGFQAAQANDPADLTKGFGPAATIYSATAPAANAADAMRVMYAGHAYPGWDASGDSLLLSWTIDENWTQMATVDWD